MQARMRYRGSLLGLAVGDAVGTTLEFKHPGSFTPIDDMVGGGPFRLKPGAWTDDTSMALCLGESLISVGFDAADQMERYIRWRDTTSGYNSSRDDCFDIGATVSTALARYERTGDPFAGLTDPYTAGNGSLMRLAPVPLFFAAHPLEALERSADSSRTTHGATTAVDACRYFAGLIIGALNGVSKECLLAARYCPIPGYWHEHRLHDEIDAIACGSFKGRQPPEIAGTGFVVRSLEAALWAFSTTETFQEGCLKAVNLGDDADTTGAIYGRLAGAYYGEQAIPSIWRTKLVKCEQIEVLADDLYRHAQR